MASPTTSPELAAVELSPVEPAPITKSNLDLIKECDNFPYFETNPLLYARHTATYYTLQIPPCTRPVGYLLPSVAAILDGAPGWTLDENARTLTLVEGKDEPERSTVVARTCAAMAKTGHFRILDGWRNEIYPIYGTVGGDADEEEEEEGEVVGGTGGAARRTTELLCSIERAASALFGIVTYGVHMTAYVREKSRKATAGEEGEEVEELKIWVPRRAATKQTYPSMLDNTVAGGIATGEQPFDCLVREAAEEASLPEQLVRERTKAVGTVTYFHIRDARAGGEIGLLQPECQYVYDLDLTASGEEDDVIPRPSDDEVEGFVLMRVGDVQAAMGRGEFKPNCALVLLDFLVRHGILTREWEADYVEIVARLHRRLGFPVA